MDPQNPDVREYFRRNLNLLPNMTGTIHAEQHSCLKIMKSIVLTFDSYHGSSCHPSKITLIDNGTKFSQNLTTQQFHKENQQCP